MSSYPSSTSAPRSKHRNESPKHLPRSQSPITPISLAATSTAIGDYSEDDTSYLPTQSGKRQFTNPSMYHDIAPALAAPFMKADGLVQRGMSFHSFRLPCDGT